MWGMIDSMNIKEEINKNDISNNKINLDVLN